MKIKLTFRYLLMVAVSLIILLFSAFSILTYVDNSSENNGSSNPSVFAYNFVDKIELSDNDEVLISEEGKIALTERKAWIQILNKEGYVTQAFNEPDYAVEHYSPAELRTRDLSLTYGQDYFFNIGKVKDDLSYLIAVRAEGWNQYTFELDQQMIEKFLLIMFILTLLILLLMGFIFSQRIASPVATIISGVERLSVGDYKEDYKEKGLYKKIFASLNQLAERLKASEREEKKTKEQREKWLSNMSHDLKTPLSTIKGYSEILSDEDYDLSPDEIKKYSETIHKKSIYMEEMIEELRLNEQLMHHGFQLDKESANLTSFIRELIIDILNDPKYKNRMIEFLPKNENIRYSFEKNLMKRALENILYNALIHNDEATKVEVKISEVNDYILFEISDNGRGMTKEDVDKLFNRYYRGTNTKDYKGSGLGMSIAKEVIKAHGGEIEVRSELNERTEINIKL